MYVVHYVYKYRVSKWFPNALSIALKVKTKETLGFAVVINCCMFQRKLCIVEGRLVQTSICSLTAFKNTLLLQDLWLSRCIKLTASISN